jgi:lysophospholipase L1-like esterase
LKRLAIVTTVPRMNGSASPSASVLSLIAAVVVTLVPTSIALAWPKPAAHPPVVKGSSTRFAIRPSIRRTGWIGVRITGDRGSLVTVTEEAAGAIEPVATIRLKDSTVERPRFLTWRCDRRIRHLVATQDISGAERRATAKVRTPSCRARLDAFLRPLRPRSNSQPAVRIVDQWDIGSLSGDACLIDPSGERSCKAFDISAGVGHAFPRIGVGRTGIWTMEVNTDWGQHLRRAFEVRGTNERMRLLATGDSMIQYVDTSLAKRLEPGIQVQSDARISTGISKPSLLDWVAHARSQVASYRPDVTVVFIGANDGFPLRSHKRRIRCCGRRWIKVYASRARKMMAAYARRKQAQVYWLTLPAPRSHQWRRIYPAVNAALRLAASRFDDEVRVIELGKVFTPHGRFRTTMKWHGRTVVVRQGDGVHLSVAGASIAAELVVNKLRSGQLVD